MLNKPRTTSTSDSSQYTTKSLCKTALTTKQPLQQQQQQKKESRQISEREADDNKTTGIIVMEVIKLFYSHLISTKKSL